MSPAGLVLYFWDDPIPITNVWFVVLPEENKVGGGQPITIYECQMRYISDLLKEKMKSNYEIIK